VDPIPFHKERNLNNKPRTSFHWIKLLPLILALFLTGCTGAALRSATSWPGVVSGDEKIFIAYNQGVYAVNSTSGAHLWAYPKEPERTQTFYAPPALSPEGILIVGDFSNTVVGLDAANGTIKWGPIQLPNPSTTNGASNGRIVGGMVIAGDLVLVPSTDGRLYALEHANGVKSWTFPPEGEDSPPLKEAIWATPLVEGDRVYVASLDHRLYSLDLKTGREIWSTEDLGGALADAPSINEDTLFIGTFNDELIALDTTRGTEVWRFQAGNWVWSSPALSEGIAYFGDLNGQLFALNTQSQAIIWQSTAAGMIAASPLHFDGNVLVVTENGSLQLLEAANGNPVWTQSMEAQLLTDPFLVEDSIIVASIGDVLLSSFNSDSGALRWSYTPPGQ
jgi:outer membrane protein assembly factor BamB